MDPLQQLRECTRNDLPIVFDQASKDKELSLNGVLHQSDQPTRFKSKKGKGPAYSLGSVWFFWKNYVQNAGEKEVDHGSYMRECKNIGVSHVSLVDRAELIAWFKENDNMDVVSHMPEADLISDNTIVAEPLTKKPKTTDSREGESNATVSNDTIGLTSNTQESDKPKPDLSSESGMTVDHLASLKQKVRERKSKTSGIKPVSTLSEKINDDSILADMDVADDFLERSKNETIAKEIMNREKPLTSYLSILQAPMQKPFNNCLKMATALAQREEKEREKEKTQQQRQASKAKASQQGHNRYQKIDENEYWKERNVALHDFQLDTRGTFEGMDLDKISQMRKEPTPVNNSNNSNNNNNNNNNSQGPSITPNIAKSTSSGSLNSTQLQARKRSHSEIEQSQDGKIRVVDKPIIIVPGRSTSNNLLNLNNAQQFLADATFVNPVDLANNPVKGNKLEFEYTPRNGTPIKFLIVDNVTELRGRDWSNVIAVFAQGQEWQFKQYPKDWGGVAGIFSHTKGFFMHYEDEKVPKNVATWNVKALPVNKLKRHHDGTAARKFWEDIDLELRKRNFMK
jgi:hypothetical protein